MGKKTRTSSNKAGKLMKCDGQMLKKVVEAKGYKLHELSKMLRYCSDYLTTCCRKNQISDVAAKYLMDYKIFPQMYDLEGEIKVGEPSEDKTKTAEGHVRGKIYIGEPKEVKIDEDDRNEAVRDRFRKRMDMLNRNAIYGIPKTNKEIEFRTPYGIVRSEKDLRNYIREAIGPKFPNCGTNLIIVRDMLEVAYFNGMSCNVEDMRNDLLVFAANADKYPEKWVDFVNHLSLKYDPNSSRSPFSPTAQEIKKVLNEKYGTLEKGVKGIDYGYGPAHDVAKGVFKLMRAAMDDLKRDPEFKEMIKQAVKEAYEEL